jgi:hypothetical protein
MRKDLGEYPVVDMNNPDYYETVHEEHVKGGLLVYLKRFWKDRSEARIIAAGYRQSSLSGLPPLVRLVPKEKQEQTKFSLTEILRQHPIDGTVPITKFSFGN